MAVGHRSVHLIRYDFHSKSKDHPILFSIYATSLDHAYEKIACDIQKLAMLKFRKNWFRPESPFAKVRVPKLMCGKRWHSFKECLWWYVQPWERVAIVRRACEANDPDLRCLFIYERRPMKKYPRA